MCVNEIITGSMSEPWHNITAHMLALSAVHPAPSANAAKTNGYLSPTQKLEEQPNIHSHSFVDTLIQC